MVNTESAVITPPRILLDWLTRGLHRFAWELEDTVVRNGGACEDELETGSVHGFRDHALVWLRGRRRGLWVQRPVLASGTWSKHELVWIEGMGWRSRWQLAHACDGRASGSLERGYQLRQLGPFENSGYGIWSGDVRDSSSAWVFDFYGGSEYWSTRSSSNYGVRVFAVRSR